MSLTSKIQALLDYANGVTSAEDTTLGDAVKTLADGYGQGGEEYFECIKAILEGGENVDIPEGVTQTNSGFYGNTKVKSITIPSSVTSIGENAFRGCKSLTSINIPSLVTSIGNYAFYQCFNLANVTIPSSVTSIGSAAFKSCASFTIITIPSSVTSIGENAFSDCSNLANVTIPSSVTSIGSSAFNSCTSFTIITIPSSVTSIGSAAFYQCKNVTKVYCYAKIPPTLADVYSFGMLADGVIFYVPAESIDAYKAANIWKAKTFEAIPE